MKLEGLRQAYSRAVRGEPTGHRLLEALFAPLEAAALIYGVAQAVRLWSYRAGLRKTKRLGCPVISVGNLTWGGTGKTPAVMMIAELLKSRGIRVAVVSRGYKGAGEARVNVVSDGTRVLLTPTAAGDEPFLLAEHLRGVPVLTSRRRYLAARYAWSKFQVDAVVLDDGFQHLELARDVNILLIDATNPWGNGKLIPRGMLREPISQMSRADAVLLTKCNHPKARAIAEVIPRTVQPAELFRSTYTPRALVNLYTNTLAEPHTLQGKRVYAFCGIADPTSFEAPILALGARLAGFRAYPDHYNYTAEDLELLEGEATMKDAELIVTTGKDGAKIKGFLPRKLPFFQLDAELELPERKEDFLNLLLSPFASRTAGPAKKD